VLLSEKVLQVCQEIATFTETDGLTSRPLFAESMRSCHQVLRAWMESLGMRVSVDAVGNLRGIYSGESVSGERLLIGSHLDSVPNAGPYDGVLGVTLAIALMEALDGQRFPYEIEVIGFSEESGQRFGTPFLGSRALVGRIDEQLLEAKDNSDISLREAIAHYGLAAADLPDAVVTPDTFAFLEYHIERGPVLESLHKPLGVVEAIVGRSRFTVEFIGEPSNSGTTPMNLRRDALSGAAEWIGMVEQEAKSVNGLFATVEKVEVFPGATGVIPSNVTMSVDMRHHSDKTLNGTIARLVEKARHVAQKRRLRFDFHRNLDHQAVVMHPGLVHIAERALRLAGCPSSRLVSGYGHDAMIIAEKVPSALIFVRSPDGLSQHPGMQISPADVELAISSGLHFLKEITGFTRKTSVSAYA
jgi:allantoate deiminase